MVKLDAYGLNMLAGFDVLLQFKAGLALNAGLRFVVRFGGSLTVQAGLMLRLVLKTCLSFSLRLFDLMQV